MWGECLRVFGANASHFHNASLESGSALPISHGAPHLDLPTDGTKQTGLCKGSLGSQSERINKTRRKRRYAGRDALRVHMGQPPEATREKLPGIFALEVNSFREVRLQRAPEEGHH